MKAKGIHAHDFLKLGKAPAQRDTRNLKLASILKAPVVAPAEYDFDVAHPGVPTPMFANDTYGDCVIAGRAHQTLRFELKEQHKLIAISDKDVLKEYLGETGGVDSGLVVLDSLREWRKQGWHVAKHTYKIQVFSEVDRSAHGEVKGAIYLDLGVGLGLSLPLSAQTQIQAGKPWDVVTGPTGKVGSWGGHYVYVSGYTKKGPVCVTWGRKQAMTWAFFGKYCDEAYAIIDAVNTAKKKQFLSTAKIDAFLADRDAAAALPSSGARGRSKTRVASRTKARRRV